MKKRIIITSLLAGGMLLLGSAAMAGQPKVLICHAPPGNPSNAHTISVGPAAVPAHLAHGDIACTCEKIDACETQGGNLNEVTSAVRLDLELLERVPAAGSRRLRPAGLLGRGRAVADCCVSQLAG